MFLLALPSPETCSTISTKQLSEERFQFVIYYIPCHNHQYSRGVIHQISAFLLHLLFVITNSMAYWLARLRQITSQYVCARLIVV